MSTMSYAQCEQIHNEALSAADQAAQDKLNELGEEWFPCGFAWVRVLPATPPFGRFLKKAGIVDGPSYGGGYTVFDACGDRRTQSMYVKEAGTKAYAKVLRDNGIECYPESRMD